MGTTVIGVNLKRGILGALATASVVLAGCSGGALVTDTTSAPTTVGVSTITESSSTTTPTTTSTPKPLPVAAYFIGNSLTNQTLGEISRDVRGFVPLARQAGYIVRPLGWHIKCGSSLLSISTNPDDVCVDPVSSLGAFDEALPSNDWDFLVVQPYPGTDSTLATDIEVIRILAQKLPARATVLVFTGWPPLDGFTDSWDSTGTITEQSLTEHSRIYFDTLMNRLNGVVDQDVALIPSGEVLYRLQGRLASGDVPELTGLADFYSDDIHLNSRGAWLSGVTAASVITGGDPSVFGKPPEPWYGENSDFSTELIQVVREVVDDVLSE